MADHEIDFVNGHLFCAKSQEGNSLEETYEIFKRMEAYYNSKCVVTHWRQRTIDKGEFVESTMKVKDAVWGMSKEGFLRKASFILDD